MKTSIFISLLLTTFALAVEPATLVKDSTSKAAVAKQEVAATKAPAKVDSSASSTEQAKTTATVNAQAKPTATVDSSAKVAPAKELVAVDSSAKATSPVKESVATDSSAKVAPAVTASVDSAKVETPATEVAKTDSSAIDTSAKVLASAKKTSTPAKKKAKKAKKQRVKKNPLIATDNFKFDYNSNFEIQAGKVFWSSEDDPDGNNMEEWFGRANLSFLTESTNFDGKVTLSFYPGNILENETVVVSPDSSIKNEARDLVELKEAWACQRTKYINFKLGRWENTDKNGDYFGGYVDGYLTGFKSTFTAENMLQFGFTPTENLSVDLALISTGAHLNTGDIRVVAHFRELSSIEALDIDLALRSNVFDKVYDSKSDIRTNLSLKVNVPLIEDKLFLFGEVAMLGLGGDSTELYLDKNNYIKSRDVVVEWKMPLTGGLMLKTDIIDRMILEAEYISDRNETSYHSNSKHIKDVLGAFYIEKDLTNRFTLSAGFHSFGSSKDWVLNGNLIGRIN